MRGRTLFNILLLVFFSTQSSILVFSGSSPRVSALVRTLNFSYAFTVESLPKDARNVNVFVPLPQSDRQQRIEDLIIESRYPYRVEKEKEYGNSILRIEIPANEAGEVVTKISFKAQRSGYTQLDAKKLWKEPLTPEARARFLAPDRLVPIDGKIQELTAQVVKKNLPDLEKARMIYDHITSTMKYDKTGSGWGNGDAIYACDVRKGNCTDFHSLFIAMARASGIPARFVIGFSIPEKTTHGAIEGYHCWAEFYTDDYGWIPVDATEAVKHPEKKEFFFGGLDEHRVQFSVGRDIRLENIVLSEPINYFIYPYVLVDGKPFHGVKRAITFSELGSLDGK